MAIDVPCLTAAKSDDSLSLKTKRDILQNELEYRRGRRWQIFAWANTILLAVTGGLIALQLQSGATLSLSQQSAASIAVVVLGGYSWAWWRAQRNIGKSLGKCLQQIDRQLGISLPDDRGSIPSRIGSGNMILLVGLAALTAIWVPAT